MAEKFEEEYIAEFCQLFERFRNDRRRRVCRVCTVENCSESQKRQEEIRDFLEMAWDSTHAFWHKRGECSRETWNQIVWGVLSSFKAFLEMILKSKVKFEPGGLQELVALTNLFKQVEEKQRYIL